MGWYKEKYRHSLAARGVRTSLLSKKSQLIDRDYGGDLRSPGIPSSAQVNVVANRVFANEPKELSDDDIRAADDEMLLAHVKQIDEHLMDLNDLDRAAQERARVKRLLSENINNDAYPDISKLNFAATLPAGSSGEHQDYFELERQVLEGEIDDPEYLRLTNELNKKYKKGAYSFSAKLRSNGPSTKLDVDLQNESKEYDFIGDKSESPVDFINGNLKATESHDPAKFWNSIKYTLAHPFKDADGEWIEYNLIAGKTCVLSKDKSERAEQRGAAIFARVASQANMEPLIEQGKSRSFRQIMTELAFGRRTGDGSDDAKLIARFEEK